MTWFNFQMNSFNQWIRWIHLYLNSYIYEFIYSLTRFQYLFSNHSITLMKLAKGSGRRIKSFEKEAHMHLQSSSLSSKLTIRDDVVRECLYICNQNYDQRVHFPLHDYLWWWLDAVEFLSQTTRYHRIIYSNSPLSRCPSCSSKKVRRASILEVWLSLVWKVMRTISFFMLSKVYYDLSLIIFVLLLGVDTLVLMYWKWQMK